MLRFVIGNMNGKAYGLNANELSVLEAVGKCSRNESAKGWFASMQALADSLPFKIDRVTVGRAVEKLINLGLIEKRENALFINVQNEQYTVQNERPNVQNELSTVQNERFSAPLNNPPVNNKLSTNDNEENIARAQSRNEDKGIFIMDYKFSTFWTAFHPSRDMNSRKAQCRWLWEELLDHSVKTQIIDELLRLEAAGQRTQERNPYFYLTHFAPKKPHDWNGDHSIDAATSAKLISALYDGHYGAFTREEVLFFRLDVATDAKPLWDAYMKYVYSDPDKHPPKYK